MMRRGEWIAQGRDTGDTGDTGLYGGQSTCEMDPVIITYLPSTFAGARGMMPCTDQVGSRQVSTYFGV